MNKQLELKATWKLDKNGKVYCLALTELPITIDLSDTAIFIFTDISPQQIKRNRDVINQGLVTIRIGFREEKKDDSRYDEE